ncbi:RnfABCDGE type electron transport complex subunit D [Leptodesmis sp.]|uniref:RnfABCDGE type electron transport complex subunit D n=1 Tax=Leptodesmis sp. TaxID=3100501 RepID=UPI0040534941
MFRDARLYQMLFLSLFVVLGIATRDWTLHPGIILVAIATCLITQGAALVVSSQFPILSSQFDPATPTTAISATPDSPTPAPLHLCIHPSFPSALITALGLSLLLRTDHCSTMMVAAIAAIGSKFLLRFWGKHIFNPANFGIVAAIALTHDAWVSPGQWGEGSWYILLFLATGGLVLQKVGRWDTTVTFLGSYACLEALRNLWLGWTWDVWLHRLTSGSLLLFALFMITDPRTIPNARTSRILWAAAIALLTFILRNVFFLPTAVFWALFALSPLSILLDLLWDAPRFEWKAREL